MTKSRDMNAVLDAIRLEEVKLDIHRFLQDKGVPVTNRNIIQAMFMDGYADWIGSPSLTRNPTCAYETPDWLQRLLRWVTGSAAYLVCGSPFE